MTEAEWDASTDPEAMLRDVKASSSMSDRKLILFAAAWFRQPEIWTEVRPACVQRAIEVAELFADGLANDSDLLRARAAITAAFRPRIPGNEDSRSADHVTVIPTRALPGWGLAVSPVLYDGATLLRLGYEVALAKHARANSARATESFQRLQRVGIGLVRDIFGGRYVGTLNVAEFLSPTVAALARAVYPELQACQLSVLADALEEAGCRSSKLLEHLRSQGPHMRGCWAVDLLRGIS
jgi:hypothetical protein